MSAPDTCSTRERLLDVAARHFAEFGYRHTSLSAVARELGISPSTVFFHFANKEELFVAAFDREARLLGDRTVGDEPESVGDGYWKSILAQVITQLADFPLVARVLRGEEPELMGRITTGDMAQRLRQTVAVSLRKGRDTGQVRADLDVEQTARALATIMISLLITTIQSGGRLMAEPDPIPAFFQTALAPRSVGD